MFSKRTIIIVLVIAVALLTLPMIAQANVTNGGFETGDLTGWTVVDEGPGVWMAFSGTMPPGSLATIPAPPEGTYAAISDQSGASRHVLYQDIAVQPGGTTTLHMFVYYVNLAGSNINNGDLEYAGAPNQHYRIDIMSPGASLWSTAGGDVLANVFITAPADPLSLSPTPVTFDLTPWAGQTVRLRAAEVDNQDNFNAGIDDVSVTFVAGGTAAEPVPGCDVSITVPSGSVGGTFVSDTAIYWAPGEATAHTIEAGKNVLVTGLDASGMYYQFIYVCDYLWAPVNTLGPNYENPWNGAPLPAGVVE
jgi:hypothetical protein